MTFFRSKSDDKGRYCLGNAMRRLYINWTQKAQNFYMSSKANTSFSRTTLFPKVTLLYYWNLACGLLQADRLHTHPRVSPPVVSFIVSLSTASRPISWQILRLEKRDIPVHCQTGECETVRAGHFKKKRAQSVWRQRCEAPMFDLKKLQYAPRFNRRSQERCNWRPPETTGLQSQ